MPARKTNKKTTAKKATKKVEELNQTHGKDEMSEKMAPSSLSQVWGDTGISKYKTLDEGEYTSYLKSLNKTDLHHHAAEMGIIPIENKENLYKRLIGEFTKHTASYRMPQVKPPAKTLSRKAKDILSEGR